MATYNGEPYPGFFKDAKDIKTELYTYELVSFEPKKSERDELVSFDIESYEPEPEHEIFPECLKNAITAFICDYKRFPNKEQFAELKAEHVTYPENPEEPYFTFTHDGADFTCEFAQMTDEEIDAIKNPVDLSVGFKGQYIPSVDLGGIFTQAQFIPEYIDSVEPIMVSALDSTKGMNKHNVSEEWLSAQGGRI